MALDLLQKEALLFGRYLPQTYHDDVTHKDVLECISSLPRRCHVYAACVVLLSIV